LEDKMEKIGMIFGTRPEAIKMAPLYRELKGKGKEVKIIATAQHREMLDQVLKLFEIKPEYDLNVMKPGQELPELTARLIEETDKILKREKFDIILVHGDTTSTMCGSLAAFYNKIEVGHVEAGLRTNNIYNPYPEEMNRRITGEIAKYHFVPTEKARENLLKEGKEEKYIKVTGNTVIDALLWVRKNKKENIEEIQKKYGVYGEKYILLTMHRRENQGEPMREAFRGIKEYIKENSGTKIIYPVHPNPKVRKAAEEELKGERNIILTEPLEYLEFVSIMDGSHYIMTDSGGIQEEAPAIGKPTLVLRETTERPEAIEAGTAKLVGTDRKKIYEAMKELEGKKYDEMSGAKNPFGQGNACTIISEFINRL